MAVHATASFVGRDAELALLEQLLADVGAGRGRALLIEGEPGIGRSALLSAGLAAAEPSGVRVLRGACEELTRPFPLWAPAQTLAPEGLPARRQGAVAEDPVTAAADQLAALVDRLCAVGPLVLAIEDLHWADGATLRLWERLGRATASAPLLLVATRRPVPVRPELDLLRDELRASGGVLIDLGGLTEPEVAKLAAERLGGAPGPRLARLLASAAGNPLYTGELLRARRDAPDPLSDAPRDLGAASARAITDRLDFLSARTRDTLRTAALLGQDFTVADLATVAEEPPDILAEELDEATAARLVEADGTYMRFRHGLIRRSLCATMPTALRAALHQHAAKALIDAGAPVERVAPLMLPVLAESEGWEAGWIAAHAADLAARAPGNAVPLLEHALARLDSTDPRHADIEDHALAVAFRLGRDREAEETARDIVVRESPERAARAAWFLGATLLRTGRRGEAAEALADVGTAVPLWRARIAALRSTALAVRGGEQDARQAADRAEAEGRRLGDRLTTAQVLYTRSVLSTLADDVLDALAGTDGILAGTEDDEDGDLAELRLTVLGDRSALLTELDRFDEAVAAAREGLARAERAVRPGAVGPLRSRAAEARYALGRWDDALAELEPAPDDDQLVPPGAVYALRALIAGQRDDWPEAARQLAALDGRRDPDERAADSGTVLRARAMEAEHTAGPRRVVEVLRPCLTPDSGQRVIDPAGLLPALVRAAQECGDLRSLRAAAQVCAVPLNGEPHPARRADLDWCTGMLRGEPARVLAAAAYYRARGRRPALGNALEDAAVVQAAGGEVTAARATLAEALDVYAEVGAVWDARRATARLRPYGVRPGVRGARQRPKNGRQALTGTERRVAELVGQGMTNPEIAGRLMLSRRTVETHVSHILTKLGISSRREVARHVGSAET